MRAAKQWSPGLALLIWRGLQREPRDRYQTAAETMTGVEAAMR